MDACESFYAPLPSHRTEESTCPSGLRVDSDRTKKADATTHRGTGAATTLVSRGPTPAEGLGKRAKRRSSDQSQDEFQPSSLARKRGAKLSIANDVEDDGPMPGTGRGRELAQRLELIKERKEALYHEMFGGGTSSHTDGAS